MHQTANTSAIVLEKIQRTGILPLIYHEDASFMVSLLTACYEAGIRAFEFTNRGLPAPSVFKELLAQRAQYYPEMALGIGSVLDTATCQVYLDLGADFIVAPILDPEVGALCQQHGTPWIPGCGTLTEVINAQRLGAPLTKIFPGSVLGPTFVKSVLGPCPDLKIMPTGGVQTTEENLKQWFDAGVFCVGLGSQLFTNPTQGVFPEAIKDKVIEVIETVAQLREGKAEKIL
ncbi:bifunctional 4-hydroxy-2-oxoglutarate aldolase/2-dehydro-3-deoxy-phosphogluconate aldolase [Algivirga pacifica]|uniref:Bifunctional 4-hydroxy-2-oxoglutarate aldolase/2-dehydro-3-deoxy-phosphogluconate aldolase n=1 Tax=Algivirga pacifica TaxID=1162670 RepID=A0ABP9DLA7_9BACT